MLPQMRYDLGVSEGAAGTMMTTPGLVAAPL
jgi:hypothetical protein